MRRQSDVTKRRPRAGLPADVLTRDYRTQVEDLADRGRALLEIWLPVDAAREAWQDFVSVVEAETESWPAWLAARAGSVARGEGGRLREADGPSPRQRPRRFLPPADLTAILAGPPARYPWPPPATSRIRGLVESGLGVEVLDGGPWGPWYPWDSTLGAHPVPRPPLQPVIVSLLRRFERATEGEAIFRLLDRVKTLPIPPRAERLEEARAQWREMRSGFRELRVRVRRGHIRRDELRRRVDAALTLFRQTWGDRWWDALVAGPACVAGDPDAALAIATEIRSDALADFRRVHFGDAPTKPERTP